MATAGQTRIITELHDTFVDKITVQTFQPMKYNNK